MPTFRGASAAVFGAAIANPTCTPTLPTGTVSGERVYIGCASKPTATAITGPDANWTSIFAGVLQTSRMSIWWRDYDGAWTMPTLTATGTTSTASIGATAWTITPGAGSTLTHGAVQASSASSTTLGATGSFSAAYVSGDVAVVFITTNANVTLTGGTFSATGVTVGTITEQIDTGSSNNVAIGLKLLTATITAGSETNVPTASGTFSAASTAGVNWLRVADVVSAVTLGKTQPRNKARFRASLW